MAGKDSTSKVWTGNGIVSLFHKTPSTIACGEFWELRWAFGCPMDCSYCYLRGTLKGKMRPRYVRLPHILAALDDAFKHIREPSILNAGELCDSLMNPTIMSRICDKFEEQYRHKVLLLSKLGPRNAEFLLEKVSSQVICAWSVNAPEVARRWESKSPQPETRIEAAKMIFEAGFDTRIRVDPIFPIEGWKAKYEALLDTILSRLTPDRIILGTPRGLWKTIRYAETAGVDMSWTRYFAEESGWGRKLAFGTRKEIYEFFYDRLASEGYPKKSISMCKETVSMWEAMGLHVEPLRCNCYGKDALYP